MKTVNSTSIRVDFRRWDVPVTSYVELLYPQENFAKGEFGSMMFKDKSRKKNFYSSSEIRFKSPAEHTINGKKYPIEMQVVHSNGDSRLIVSIFLSDEKNDMSMMKSIFEKSNEEKNMDKFSSSMTADEFFKAAVGDEDKAEDLYNEQVALGGTLFGKFKIAEWKAQNGQN